MYLRTALLATLALPLIAQQTAQTSLQGVPAANIDKSANPCTDFDAYANGAWRAANPMPAIQTTWALRTVAQENTRARLRTIAEEDAAKSSSLQKGSPAQLVGDFYASCIDEAAINRRGLAPLKPWIAEINSVKDPKTLSAALIHLQSIGISVPISIGSTQNLHEPTSVIAEISVRGLGLPDRDYYLRDEPRFKAAREKYLPFMHQIFVLAGMSDDEANAAGESVMRIETEIAKTGLSRVERRDPHAEDHLVTFADLKTMASHYDWDQAFDSLHIPKTGSLNVSQPKQLAAVNALIADDTMKDWRAFLTWHLLRLRAATLPTAFGDASFAFYGTVLTGTNQQRPRWQRCTATVDSNLGEALGHEYVDRFFPPESKARARQMAINIAAELRRSIETRDWMTEQTRKRALDKVDKLNIKIGYPDTWKTYAGVTVARDTFLENTNSTARFEVIDDLSQIGKPVDHGRWGMTPPTLNAYYNPALNEIVVPAGYLQPPGFNPQGIDAVNYGAIGVSIGHEISHGVDDEGAQFSAEGKLEKWWTDEDYKNFEARTACTTKQYDNFFVEPELHINGKLVTGEALGDLGGVNFAYRAYKRSREGKGPEPTIDGYTPDQQFFLAEAQWRGALIRPEYQRTSVSTDPHPSGHFRVIGPLSNMPEFEKAFQCKAGDPMVRSEQERCTLW